MGLVHGLNEPSAQTIDSTPLLIMASFLAGVLLHVATNLGVHFPSDSAVPRADPSRYTRPEGAGTEVFVGLAVGGIGVLVGWVIVRDAVLMLFTSLVSPIV